MKRLLFFTTILLVACQLKAVSWNKFDIGTGVKPTIAVDSNNIPHITFLTEDLAGAVFYAKYKKDYLGFTTDTLSKGYFYGPCDIEIDNLNNPHVTYHDHDLNGGNFAYHAFNGVSWDSIHGSHPGHDGWDSEILFGPGNSSHVVYIDPPVFGPGSGVEYAVFDGQQWNVEALNTNHINYGFGLGFQLNTQNLPYVSYYDNTERDLYLANKVTGSWVLNKVDSVGDVGKYSSLVLEGDSVVHLGYIGTFNGDTSILFHNYLKDGVWTKVAIDTLVDLSSSARKILSMEKDFKNNLNIVYGTKRFIVHLKKYEGIWEKDVVLDASNEDASLLGEGLNFKLDSKGFIHIAFYESDDSATNGWKVKYLTNSSDIVQSTSIALNEKKFKVFPNPFDDYITVSNIQRGEFVTVYNGLGILLYCRRGEGLPIDVELYSHPPGIYLVQITDLAGRLSTFKVLKN